MPENIDSLLADLGVTPETGNAPTESSQTTEAPVEAPAETASVENTENTVEQTEPTETSNETDMHNAEAEMQAQVEQQRANQAFAAMRAENSRYKKFMQTLMRGSNFAGNEDAFIEALENEAYKKQAQLQGLAANPELLRKMDQQEEKIKELTESQRDQTLMLGLKTLQETNNLTGKEVEAFVQRAIDNHVDLLASGLNFDTLYKGMFFNDIMKKKIEEERQNWIKQSNKADSAATPDGKSGKGKDSPTDVKTMAEFNSLLNTVSKEIN